MQTFTKYEYEFRDLNREVYKLGEDDLPAILLLIELPGMTKHTLDFARRLHAQGYSIHIPLLFGKFNSPYQPGRNLFKVCIQREFNLLAHQQPSFISDWLRSLSREIGVRSGRQIGAIGMCFTGSFVVSLMLDETIVAPVMSQPGHAKGFFGRKRKSSLGIPDSDIAAAAKRAKDENIQIAGYRFENDVICPKERFDQMEKVFGNNFIRFEIDNSLFNEHNIPIYAHAVHTVDYCDKEDHPTKAAFDHLICFLDERLKE